VLGREEARWLAQRVGEWAGSAEATCYHPKRRRVAVCSPNSDALLSASPEEVTAPRFEVHEQCEDCGEWTCHPLPANVRTLTLDEIRERYPDPQSPVEAQKPDLWCIDLKHAGNSNRH
jgi:hypothetical protein